MSSAPFQRLVDAAVKSPLRTVWLALPTTGLILVSGEVMYSAWKGPFQLDLLAYYLLFFFFGCYLHRKPSLFLYVWRSFRINLTLGLVFLTLGLGPTVLGRLALDLDAEGARRYASASGFSPRVADLLSRLAGSDAAAFSVMLAGVFISCVATWMLMFWVFGRANAYYSKPIPVVRYLTDASFFLYLAHFPLVKVFQSMVRDLSLPVALKFAIVAGGTVGILLVLFHFFVRETWLGVMLGSTRAKLKRTLSV